MLSEIERATNAMWAIPCPMGHDEWFSLMCSIKTANVPKPDVRSWCESGEGFNAAAFESTWRSIDTNGGISEKTLYKRAKECGFNEASKLHPTHPIAKPSPSPTKPFKQAASGNAVAVWEWCIPATNCEAYIDRKQGKPDGLRVYPASAPQLFIGKGDDQISATGGLVVPCYAPDGKTLQTLQIIPLVGEKKNLPLATFGDGFFTVGEIADRAYIVEGIGQAWAVNQATGCAAVVCFGAGRMATVAKVLRDKFPAVGLVVVSDRSKEEQAAKIAADVSGHWIAMPADKPSNYDANDYAQEFGTGALSDLLQRPVAPKMRFNLLSGDDLCNAPPEPYLVRGVLPAKGVGALFGASGSGKGFVVISMACAIAAGDYDWFGRRVTQTSVTYIWLEGAGGAGKRLRAWTKHHKRPLPDRLQFITQQLDLLGNDVPDLAKAINAGGVGGLVIIDTLNCAAPGADENSSVDMGNIIAAVKQLQILTGGFVLLVHHTGKDATKGLRGHSSLYAALDGVIEVTATDTRRAWSVAKSKDDVTGDAHPFKLEIVTVGNDDEGDEITSCVIVQDDSKEANQQKRPALGANQKIARKVLGEPLRKSQHFGKEGAPAGRPCISYDEAVSIVAESMPTDKKHQRSSAKSAIAALVDKKYMDMKGEWLWDS